MDKLYGGIEANGGKLVCAVADENCEISTQTEIAVGHPVETTAKVIEFFKAYKGLSAIGFGSFGTLDLDRRSPDYGRITYSPNPAWRGTDIRGSLQTALNVPVYIQSAAGCAALGEYHFGPWKGAGNLLYVSLATAISGAVVIEGRLVPDKRHPEIGHLIIPHDTQTDPFPGTCPFHGDCWEGLASLPALAQRAGQQAGHVIDPVRWDLEARYIAFALVNLIDMARPDIVILGGDIMRHGGLIDEAKRMSKTLVNGYYELPGIELEFENNAVKGALKLAASLAGTSKE